MTTDTKQPETVNASLEVGVAIGRLLEVAAEASRRLSETYGTRDNKGTADRLTRAVTGVCEAMGLEIETPEDEAVAS